MIDSVIETNLKQMEFVIQQMDETLKRLMECNEREMELCKIFLDGIKRAVDNLEKHYNN